MKARARQPRVRGARPIVIDGRRFASRKEARRYADLRLLERQGVIRELRCQPRYELQPAFQYRGEVIRAITYVADFEYFENGILVIEDVKGHATDVFKLKWKILQRKFRDTEGVEVRVTGLGPRRKARQ